jgi:hypothetical protein
MSESDALTRAINEIQVSDAVFVMGAGASYAAGMPLTGQLSPLVWHTLDRHPAVRGRLASVLGLSDQAAKSLVGDEDRAIRLAFEHIGADAASRHTFQQAFASLDAQRRNDVSSFHDALVRLVYVGRALRVVSLNWDTLLETAFGRRYGAAINAQGRALWKPHGDCSDTAAKWILPFEEGFISDEIVADLEALAIERPRVLFIVGYSEPDDAVVHRLVNPLVSRWRVFRLSPRATGEGAIQLPAVDGLIRIATALCPSPEVPGWEFVSFDHQRGLEAAISGERLGPRDVDYCPRLPHFKTARRALEIVNKVDIAGPPGCGKSITAWQLARELNQAGWLVLRPAHATQQGQALDLTALRNDRWKRVVVVDDAQTFASTSIERLAELAGPRLTSITATTEATGERPRSVRIPTHVAVEQLTSEFRRRREEVLPIVQKYDSRIGDDFMATPFEWRLDEAAKSSTPWQFAFVLRGGWTRAREQFDALRDFDRADLLLVLIAGRQLLSLDSGSELNTLIDDALALGRTKEWALTTLDLLRRQEAVLPGAPIRCLHIESARIVVETALKRSNTDSFQPIVAALRRLVYDGNAPTRGIHWLNEQVLGADAFRYSNKSAGTRFYERDALEALVKRLLGSRTALERRDAAFVLSRLLWYDELDKERLRTDFTVLRGWLETVTSDNAYALAELLIYLGRTEPYSELVRSMDPSVVWERVKLAEPSTGYSWGRYLGRLAASADRNWRKRALDLADRHRLFELVARFTPNELVHLREFVLGIANFDTAFGLECLRHGLPTLKAAFGSNALAAYQATSDLEHRLLGHPLFSPPRPSKVQRDLSRQFTNAIRPEEVASGIATCRFGDWETYARLLTFVKRANPGKHRAIVAAIPWDLLEQRCATFWSCPPRELRLLLSNLAARRDVEPVRSWLLAHSHLIQEIDPILTGLSPKSAIAVLARGGRVNLAGHNQSDWQLQSWALAQVAEVDKSRACEVLRQNEHHVLERLSKLNGLDAEEFIHFLKVVDDLDEQWLKAVLRKIDGAAAADSWQRVLRDDRPKTRKGAQKVLRFIVEKDEGTAKNLADAALKSAPSQPPRHRRRDRL